MLLPVLQGIQNDLNCLKEAVDQISEKVSQQDEVIKDLNDTVSILAGDFQDHKNETASHFSEVETKLEDLHITVLSFIDSPPTEAISESVLLKLLPYLNDIEEDVVTKLGELIDQEAATIIENVISLSEELNNDMNLNTVELAHVWSSINSSQNEFHFKLFSAHESINREIYTVGQMIDPISATLIDVTANLSCVKTDIGQVSDAVSDLSGQLDVHIMQLTSHDAQTSLQSSTDHFMQLSAKMDTLQSTFNSFETQFVSNISSELESLDVTVNLLMASNFSDVLNGLSIMSDEICEKIDNHMNQTTSELTHVWSSINSSQNELHSKLSSAHESINQEIYTLGQMIDPLSTTLIDVTANLSCVKRDIGQVSDAVSDLSRQLDVNIMQLTTHEVTDTQTSLQSSTDHFMQLSAKMDTLQSTLDSFEMEYGPNISSELESLDASINTLMTGNFSDILNGLSIMSDAICEKIANYMNQTTVELAHVWSSINSSQNELHNKLSSAHESMDREIYSLEKVIEPINTALINVTTNLSCVMRGMTNVSDAVSDLSGQLKVYITQTSHDLNDTLQSSTDQLVQLSAKMDTFQSIFETQFGLNISSELESLDATINTLITSDVINGLSTMSDEICEKIEDHDNKTADRLLYVENGVCSLLDPTDRCYTCGGTGGWRRVVYLDMTDPNTNCPSGWQLTGYSKRTCGRTTDEWSTCDSVFFPVSGREYSQVCGRIKAYAFGWTPAFGPHYLGYSTVEEAYFHGVAVMRGSPRQHIWTFAAGGAEGDSSSVASHCPCDASFPVSTPSFVDNDYFCESGYAWPGSFNATSIYKFHGDDPLWDGKGCHFASTCCSMNSPPYFTKMLNTTTDDDIELRMCHYSDSSREDTAVELVELYVK